MAVNLEVPPLGESVPDAILARWLKKPGDPVAAGEPVLELETDKVSLEVTAPVAGVLGAHAQQEGDTVRPGQVVGRVEEGGGAAATPTEAPTKETPPQPAPASAEERTPPRAAPSVRRLAEEAGVSLNTLEGSGPSGRVLRQDVLEAQGRPEPAPPAAVAAPTPPPDATGARAPGPEERVRLSRRRLTIARRLVEAQSQAAMLTTFNEIDMSGLMDLRTRHRDAFFERHQVKLGYMSLFTRAVVGALKAFPSVNAELDGEELILKRYYHIGIAMAADEGLVVPVVRDADRKNLAEIERDIARLRDRTVNHRLTLSDLEGGTFTITNGGVFGSLFSTPILNQPQVAILGMHAVQDRPVAVAGRVEVRPMMYVALSYDHRVIDGSEAVRFLVAVKGLAEDPERLLLDA